MGLRNELPLFTQTNKNKTFSSISHSDIGGSSVRLLLNVKFILDLLKLRGKTVVVSAQMNYANDDLIEMESNRKISQALIEGERIAAEEELIKSIEDPNLMQQQ